MSNNKNIETIEHQDKLIAIIIRCNYSSQGVKFFTPESFPQQLGYIAQKKGHVIEAHSHKISPREISLTQEVLFIKRGKVQVDFYNEDQQKFDSRILQAQDIILLSGIGGHGYKVLEDAEMIEIKQGPYLGKDDKVRF